LLKKPKILIVDDSIDLLEVLKIFLEGKSCQVCTVNSKELFTTQLKTFKPEVIILDVYVKNFGDGREICRAIKYNIETKNIPVILMSADNKALENYEECNADAIIEKPFNLFKLIQQINSVIIVDTETNIYLEKE